MEAKSLKAEGKKSTKMLNDLQKKRVSSRPDLLTNAARRAITVCAPGEIC